MERLERANQELKEEVRALRAELGSRAGAAAVPPVQERVTVLENRVEEQAKTKVEASQRFPIRVTGMALFNTFLNSSNNGGSQYPDVAVPGHETEGGATFRQTVLGLDYSGPRTVWGGQISGSVFMDFFGGTGGSLNQLVRIRTATIAADWQTRRVAFGLDKPIIAPREPNSFAQVGVSPLTGAGNLWLWVPQFRIEQKISFSKHSGVTAQLGVVQTRESYTPPPGVAYTPFVDRDRPGLEGRFEFHYGDKRRIEIAPGFHTSASHVDSVSVPSNLFSLDWMGSPLEALRFTGAFFSGENASTLGTGGAGQGVLVRGPGMAAPVHSVGGWGQLTYQTTPRLSFNLFSGQHNNRVSDLVTGQVGKNLVYGANLFYRIAPNVILSFESSQVRTRRTGTGTILNNHYDLAAAYLF